jgi:hypothetical protein
VTTVAKVFNPSDIFQGPADVYYDIQSPASAVPPVQGTNTFVLDSAGQPTDAGSAGFHLGLTEGPCSLSLNPKFNEIHADQFAGPIDAAFVSMACEVEFAIKEYNLSRFPKYFTGVATGTYFNLGAGSTNPAADFLQLGSSNSAGVNRHTLMLIAPLRNTSPQMYMYMFAYKTALISQVQLEFSRKKESVFKCKFRCMADTSRVATDQVMQIVKRTS